MNKFSIVAAWLIFLLSSTYVFTQDELDATQTESLNAYGEVLLDVLQNQSQLAIPNVDQYEAMIRGFDHRVDERYELLESMPAALTKRTAEVPQMVQKARLGAVDRDIQVQNLKYQDVQIKIKKNLEVIIGGNAVFTYEGDNGQTYNLIANGIYHFDGEWFVLNKIYWN